MFVTAEGRYTQLESIRRTFLDRARDAALYTIPTLVPPDGAGPHTKYYTPFQSIGARGVNNLAAKLLLALIPPNSPFFKMVIDDYMIDKMAGQPGMRAEVDKALNRIERTVMTEIEAGALRVAAFEALKQLIVAGNVLCYLVPGGGMKVFKLDRFVVHRDPMGNVLEIITKEEISPLMLPEEFRKSLKKEDTSPEKTISMFTRIKREKGNWTVLQEVKGQVLPGSRGTYPLDKSPWIVLRWTKLDGEDYGRGYVEEYYGDLKSLESLTQSLVEGSAAAAKVIFLVNPNGTTNADVLSKSPNGAIRNGNAEDISVVQLEKFNDFRVVLDTVGRIEQRLAAAFLLAASVQRDAERVTAEEIRIMAGELEDALGGVYSILSQEFQLPLVQRLLFQLERDQRLPPMPKGMVKPAITTGLEALGRGHDGNKLMRFIGAIAQIPEALRHVNLDDLITRLGTSEGIEMTGLIKSKEEMAQEAQMAQMQMMIDKLGPNAMNIVRDQMDPSKNGQTPNVPNQ